MLLAVPGVGTLLDGLAAYTQRHMARLDRLLRATALLDYTLGAMRVVAPDQAAPRAGAGGAAAPALPQVCERTGMAKHVSCVSVPAMLPCRLASG